MKIRDKLKENKESIRTVLMLMLSIMLLLHIIEYKSLIVYDESELMEYNDLKSESFSINKDYIHPREIYIDFDKNTKRDNTLLKIMMDLFVISLLWKKD